MSDDNRTDDQKAADAAKAADAPKVPLRGAAAQRAAAQAKQTVGPGNEPGAALSPDQAFLKEDEGTVAMIFKKEIVLTDDNHKRVRFPVGLVNVPEHLADHWYLAAHGVVRADSVRPQQPQEPR